MLSRPKDPNSTDVRSVRCGNARSRRTKARRRAAKKPRARKPIPGSVRVGRGKGGVRRGNGGDMMYCANNPNPPPAAADPNDVLSRN